MVGFEKLAYEDFIETTLMVLESLPITKNPSLADTLKYHRPFPLTIANA
jgi:hypothetical protein